MGCNVAYTIKHQNKCKHVANTTVLSLQHNICWTKFSRTFLEVYLKGWFTVKYSITQTAGKRFVCWVNWLMACQFVVREETLWTIAAYIRLHTPMSSNVFFKNFFAREFLLANVAREPGTFIVWREQMSLELVRPREPCWTVSTRVWLSSSVYTNVKLEVFAHLVQLAAVSTVIRPSVAVCTTFMLPQAAGIVETSVTRRTLVWFLSCVHSHVTLQTIRLTKCLVTHATFERFLSAVNSVMNSQLTVGCKSSATNRTFKRATFSQWMNSPPPVCCQLTATYTALDTFCALVLACTSVRMTTQAAAHRWKLFPTLSRWINLLVTVRVTFLMHI